MKKKNIIIGVIAILMAVFSFPIYAETQCLTAVSTASSSSRATTGTSVTITATTTGSSCTVSTLSMVSSPSLTVNDPASGQYSGFSAGTAKTFTITAGTSGTYTYYARGTTTAGGVDSTAEIMEFISPSDLTVTPSPSSATIAHNNMFNLTISIQNPQASDVATSYTLNLPSGLTRNSGDPTSSSGTTVSASSTKTVTIEVKHSTCYTGSKTITFDLGDTTSAASVAVTGNTTCSSGTSNTSTSSSSGSGGGSSSNQTSNLTKSSRTFTVINPGVKVTHTIATTSIGVKLISIEVNNRANNVKITVTKLDGQPASVTKTITGTVFQYLDIDAENLSQSNIKSAKLKFNVTKSWLTQNGFSTSDIVLLRFTTSWEKLPTVVLGESVADVEYEATTPGFSTFAIATEKAAAAPPAQPAGNETTPAQPAENQTATVGGVPTTQAPTIGVPSEILYIAVALIIAIIAGYFHYHHPRTKAKYSYKAS